MTTPTLDFEKQLWNLGFTKVCGIDEAGRGSFAGPVVAGAVIFHPNLKIPDGINDSKLLSPKKREILDKEIKKIALSWAVGEISVRHINKLGIGKATQMAFRKTVKKLSPDYVLIDAFYIKHMNRKKQKAIIKGDQVCASISAASIIAKVYRDGLMKKLHNKYPEYGFDKHKGYGTKDHRDAIKTHGLCPLHRKSFNLQKFL